MSKRRTFLAALALALASSTQAQIPQQLSLQGRLAEGGAPLTGAVSGTVKLFTDPISGSQVHEEAEVFMLDDEGLFVSTLGDGATLPTSQFGQPLWAEVSLNAPAATFDRLPLQAAPYALRALAAEGLGGKNVIFLRDEQDGQAGATLESTLAGITDASSSNRYTIFLGPGYYDVGADGLQMKSYVRIQGLSQSGSILGSPGSNDSQDFVVQMANESELASVSVSCFSSSTGYCNGVDFDTTDRAVLRDVEVSVGLGTTRNTAIRARGASGEPQLIRVRAQAQAAGSTNAEGLLVDGTGVQLSARDSVFEASPSDSSDGKAIWVRAGNKLTLKDCEVYLTASGTFAQGEAVVLSGSVFPTLLEGCRIVATHDTQNTTIHALQLESGVTGASVVNSTLITLGGLNGRGIQVGGGSELEVLHSKVLVQDADISTVAAQVDDASSKLAVVGGRFEAFGGGSFNYRIYTVSGTPTVGFGGTQLIGTTSVGAGTVTCVGAFDESFAALDATCN